MNILNFVYSLSPNIMEYSYIPQQFAAGVLDAVWMKYSIITMIHSERVRRIIGRTLVPNIIFIIIYLLIGLWWFTTMLLYVPLVIIQFLVNYYMLLKANSALGKLFRGEPKKFDLVEKITDTLSDSVFCNITLVTSTILYHIFRNIGVFKPICEIVYAVVFSMIMGYTISINFLLEAGLDVNSRMLFIESHLLYLIGYGAPLTVGFYTLPLVVYLALQAILVPLMIVNTREYFIPRMMPHSLPVVTWLNQFNGIIFRYTISVVQKVRGEPTGKYLKNM